MEKSKLEEFKKWLEESAIRRDGKEGRISDNSVKEYSGGINTISTDMLYLRVITKSLSEFDKARSIIFRNHEFKTKNKTGKKLYSNALEHYRSFLDSINWFYDFVGKIYFWSNWLF